MSKEQINFEEHEGLASAEAFADFLGDDIDHLQGRLLEVWRTKGKEAARHFCINDADKFGPTNETILFLEKELFDADSGGLDKKTPWNAFRRSEAGLPHLHSYDDFVS